jgi:hypothetical protein
VCSLSPLLAAVAAEHRDPSGAFRAIELADRQFDFSTGIWTGLQASPALLSQSRMDESCGPAPARNCASARESRIVSAGEPERGKKTATSGTHRGKGRTGTSQLLTFC